VLPRWPATCLPAAPGGSIPSRFSASEASPRPISAAVKATRNLQGFHPVKVLVVDVGGTHVKLAVAEGGETAQFDSDHYLTPEGLVARIAELAAGWQYDTVSLGYPGSVGPEGPTAEPGHLGTGWVQFDFAAALKKRVRVVNDAVLQALGAYHDGRMLFLGLGTGLGSALVTERVIVPLELGELPSLSGGTLADRLGRKGLERDGLERWRQTVGEVMPGLRRALMADYVVLGGGNAAKVDPLPPNTRRGGNDDAITGGYRLWREFVEPHDRAPSSFWRVLA
jgi:polyphosphate glucokinase